MNERRLVLGLAAAALLAMAIVAWLLLSPGWAVRALDQMAEAQLGRHFTAKGGAHLEFSPLAIRFEEAALAGSTDTGERLVTAKSLVIPVTFTQLVSRRPQISALALREAEFALLIDERGQASWDFPAATLSGGSLRLSLEQASFRYFDARNGQALRLANVDGVMSLEADGSVAFNGSAVMNSHVARIDFALKSLPRVNADGSPLELAIETDAASLSFSGRLSTAKVMNLAGPLSITAQNPAPAARWAGLVLPDDVTLPGPLNLTGALDSAGRAYALRNTTLAIGQFQAAGDLVTDLRGERPKLQANLNSGPLWLDVLLPASGAEAGSWGRKPLSTAILRSFDAEVNVMAEAVSLGELTAGPSRLAATLKDGKLNASGAMRLADGGTASFTTTVDAVVLPPAGTLTLKAENANLAPLITAITGIGALSGTGNLSAELSAQGRTQEELAGTLKGSASLSRAGEACRDRREPTRHRAQHPHPRWLGGGTGRNAALLRRGEPRACGWRRDDHQRLGHRRGDDAQHLRNGGPAAPRARHSRHAGPARNGTASRRGGGHRQLGGAAHLPGYPGHPEQSRRRLRKAPHAACGSARQLNETVRRGIFIP